MRTLLIVADNPGLLNAMPRLLSFYGFTVRTAKDKNGLLSELNSFKPDILLLDIQLGNEDGRQLCKSLRDKSENDHITIVLGSESPKELENWREFGADGAVKKPFEINDLINQLKSAVLIRKQVLHK